MDLKKFIPFSRAVIFGGLAASSLLGAAAHAQTANPLPTGKNITLPPLGTQANVGSLPMNEILTPDGKYAITTDMGFRESLHAISTTTGQDAGSPLQFGKDNGDGSYGPPGLYYGLAIKANGDGSSTLYASEGASSAIAMVNVSATGGLTLTKTIALKTGDFPAGLALDGRGYLYVADNESYGAGAINDLVTPGRLLVLNAATGAEVGRYSFVEPVGTLNLPSGPQPFSPTNFPLAVAALKDGSKVYVTSQRDNAVYALDTSSPASPKALATIPTGQHPISLLLDHSQARLFVANAHSDTVSVVSTATNAITHTVLLQPTGDHSLAGITPTGLGLAPDESRLYVSLGDFNAVGVVDTSAYSLLGYVPAGWYPTGVVASPFKNQILVANAKGTRTRSPNPSYQQYTFANEYDLNLIEGNVETIPVPTSTVLGQETQQVLNNNRFAAIISPSNPLSTIGLRAGKIKHVIYIIKENRTYDQVLGDEPYGNGDPTLALFGREVTPNLHALAERFVLLDNFYDCGEASGDGWPWSTQGQASEYVIKNLPYNYSGRGRNYDFEGTNQNYPVAGFPTLDPYGQPLVPQSPFHDRHLGGEAPAIRDVSEAPGGHVWDDVLNNLDLSGTGLTHRLRNYGFFSTFGDNVAIPDNYPAAPGLQPAGHDLGGITDIDFRRFDTAYADSDGPQQIGSLYPVPTYGHYNAPSRFSEWNREFREALAADPTGNGVAAFQTIRLMHDHTQGLSPNKHTPRAEVADNDYGIGQLVEAVSHSALWNNTAIFIIEDDAQDGPDHVDCHRSTCYVISPFIKKNSVDHTFYNTDSVLHSMEQLLGIPPMNQYDAVATPIGDFDTTASNGVPYAATLPSAAILGELAPNDTKSALLPLEKLTAKMDFVHPDSAPAGLLNEIIWKSVKGVDSKMPAPRHVRLPLAPNAIGKAAAKTASTTPKDSDGD